jgi:hypothetical protein
MANLIKNIDLSKLPQTARQELYDFYLFLVNKYAKNVQTDEEEIDIFPKKVEKFDPLKREDIYAR